MKNGIKNTRWVFLIAKIDISRFSMFSHLKNLRLHHKKTIITHIKVN